MLFPDMRRAIEAAPRLALPELARALWKAHAAGSLVDDDAQALAELIEARKAIPISRETKRRTGSRARSAASVERRRCWSASGWMPPAMQARFTQGEAAALAVIAQEARKPDGCRLPIARIAAVAGVSRTTAKNAMREARALGLISIEERRVAFWRNAPNVVRIVSAEWSTWLRVRARKEGTPQPRDGATGGGVGTAITTTNRIPTTGSASALPSWKIRGNRGKTLPDAAGRGFMSAR